MKMNGQLRIDPVTDKQGVMEFVKFPFKLYRGDPKWSRH